MIQKIKKMGWVAASAALTLPVSALAQFKTPENTNLPKGSILDIVTNFMKWILIIVGILGVIAFVISGILYLTAAGDEERIGKAKKTLVAAIIGVLVALIGVIVIQAIQRALNANAEF